MILIPGQWERLRDLRRHRAGPIVAWAGAALVALMAPALAHARPGELDRSFGDRGKVVPWHVHSDVTSVDIGRKGRIVAAGNYGGDFIVAGLRPNGDSDFFRRIPAGSPQVAAASVAIARNGAVVGAGMACPADEDTCESRQAPYEIAVFRLRPDGRLNRQFGHGGFVRINFGKQFHSEPAVALASHGGILVKATDCPAGGRGDCDVGVARLRPDGSLDRAFGNQGKAVTPTYYRALGRCASRFEVTVQNVDSMALDSRGRIVVLLTCARTANPALARFKANGHPDRSFGKGGRVFKELDTGAVTAIATDSRNRIDVAGANPKGYAVARFRGNGRLDRSFGKKGTATARFGPDQSGTAVPYSLALDSRERIVAGGVLQLTRPAGWAGAVARFKRNGHVNRRFGRGGAVILKRRLKVLDSIAIDSRDRIVAAGNLIVRLLG